MRTALLALVAGATAAPHAPPAAPGGAPAHAATAAGMAPEPGSAPATLPPFAAELAQMPMIADAGGWHGETGPKIWELLANSTPQTRQSVRWQYALGLIGENRGADALGVLDVMHAGDRDLELVAPWQLARGAALTMLGRNEEAVAALSMADLAGNAEACAWRVRALAGAGQAAAAVANVNCALPAINGRDLAGRRPFVLAAAGAAIDAGQPQPALGWLKMFADQAPDANLLRGRALIADHQMDAGRLRLERVQHGGTPAEIAGAKLALIEAGLTAKTLAPSEALKQLDAFRYTWRGGPTEERALRLQFQLATAAHDLRGQLRAGATLFRYFKLGAEAAPMLATVQAQLSATLAPGSGVSLPEAAGLYWDYRELAPAGAEGDMLVLHLADRLQAAGLYARAAELLQYQLMQRAEDVAQGPLSVKVAALHILAGKPARALDAIRTTEQPSYTPAMRQDRKRMEAVALHRLGKDDAAMAALDSVPGGDAIKAEMFWRAKNWGSFAAMNQTRLPAAKTLDAPDQAAVLRHAVALAMLGREPQLQQLRARYAGAFRTLPSGKAFEVLTGKPGSIDPAAVGAAMAAIPDASPIGPVGDLLDAE